MTTVFVYGTLRNGCHNSWMMVGSRSLGADSIEGKYVGALGSIPLIEPGEGSVQGELYEVNSQHLDALDKFEGLQSGLYVRRTETTHKGVSCEVYWPSERLLQGSRYVRDASAVSQ